MLYLDDTEFSVDTEIGHIIYIRKEAVVDSLFSLNQPDGSGRTGSLTSRKQTLIKPGGTHTAFLHDFFLSKLGDPPWAGCQTEPASVTGCLIHQHNTVFSLEYGVPGAG